MEYTLRQVNDDDYEALLSVFNHYVETSCAVYFEDKVDDSFLIRLRQMTSGYPFYVIETPIDQVVGFGFLRRHHPAKAFDRIAELSYFISPSYTRKGLGTKLLNLLAGEAVTLGIDILLASISSKNQSSLDFHEKNGFVECGRFVNVGQKFGHDFDIVWMQKSLRRGEA